MNFRPGHSGLWLLAAISLAAVSLPEPCVMRPVRAGDPSDAIHACQLWIEQLGSPSYEAREEAMRALQELGAAALVALQEARDHDDPEIRYRSRQLLQLIEQSERERSLERLLEGADDDFQSLLPGWDSFSAIAGDDASARALFVRMYRAEPRIMPAIDGGGGDLTQAVEVRCLELRQSSHRAAPVRASLGSTAALLLAVLQPHCSSSPGARSVITNQLGQTEIRRLVLESEDSPMRQLLSEWVASAADFSATSRLGLAVQLGLESSVEPARELITSRAPGASLQMGILAMARFGGPDEIAHVERLLSDTSVLAERQQRGQPRFTSQVRDIALLSLLHLTGQNPADYGFHGLQPNAQYLYVSNSVGFDSDEQREEALAQWRLWKRVQGFDRRRVEENAVEGIGL